MPLEKPRFRISQYRMERGRNLKAREQRIQKVSISLTSMVDMFAILVIFLLVNSGKVAEWVKLSHTLKIPQVFHGEEPAPSKTITLIEEKFYLEKKIISEPDLATWFKQHQAEVITIAADENTDYAKVYGILDLAEKNGITQVQLATEIAHRQ